MHVGHDDSIHSKGGNDSIVCSHKRRKPHGKCSRVSHSCPRTYALYDVATQKIGGADHANTIVRPPIAIPPQPYYVYSPNQKFGSRPF